ncbi:MAG: hypothetical protein ABW001_09105 [Mycobacterium sp.]
MAPGQLRDPEGLTRVDCDGGVLLVVASSFGAPGAKKSGQRQFDDGLLRVPYTPHGALHAEAMPGFRDWLLRHVPSLAPAGRRNPDAGGLNVEGLAWDPHGGALLFGLRAPAVPGEIALIRVPVDVGAAVWTTTSLGPPSIVRTRIPKSAAPQGVRDISFDESAGHFLILLGRSTSGSDAPFQLGTWDGNSDQIKLLDVAFHRSMKPEGVTAFRHGDETKILVVDDGGGYAVLDYPATISRSRGWTRGVPGAPWRDRLA